MKLAVTICATERYTYAMRAQARRVAPQLHGHDVTVILVGDGQAGLTAAAKEWEELAPNEVKIDQVDLEIDTDEHENYQANAQLLIAQLRSVAFSRARALGVDACWSLDSDVLPPANALRCMLSMLDFDDGYYGVTTCPYPSQGGGGWLGGRGNPMNPIAEDFLPSEREVPEKLRTEFEAHEKAASACWKDTGRLTPELEQRGRELNDKIKACPPKGNVFAMNGEQWRQRGWLEAAYPAIGRGAIVPSDWCGFGCTLMGPEALDLAHFEGYEGRGTEDLYIAWHRWHPAGVRICVIPHCLADHVIRAKVPQGEPPKYVLLQGHHETSGECVGHIRLRRLPWYDHTAGETADAANDGRL